MGKRKYSYLFYQDGHKEKILNWFNANPYSGGTRIVVFTQNGTYLYIDHNREMISYVEPIDRGIIRRPQPFFYKLRDGVHDIDVEDVDIWYVADSIDRMEIIMN